MDNSVFEQIVEKLHAWKPKGFRVLDDGTQIVARVPHVAEFAWFHKIYAPLSKEEIADLQSKIRLPLPEALKSFLFLANGINLFSDKFRICGLRETFARSGDAIYKPYNLVRRAYEVPENAPSSWLPFGSWSWDGSIMFFDVEDDVGKIYRSDRDNASILNEWNSFEEFLVSEVERLSKLFDEDGKQINEDVPTTP